MREVRKSGRGMGWLPDWPDDGAIPFPGAREKVNGGHAIVAVGYDNAKKIKNTEKGGTGGR